MINIWRHALVHGLSISIFSDSWAPHEIAEGTFEGLIGFEEKFVGFVIVAVDNILSFNYAAFIFLNGCFI